MNKTSQDINKLVKFTVFSLHSTDSAELKASKEASRLQFTEGRCGWRRGVRLMLLATLMCCVMTAQGQAVIMNGDYYLTHNEAGTTVNTEATTTFNPATCLWVYASRDYIRTANSAGTAIANNNNYLQYASLSLGSDWGNWYRGNNNENIYHRVLNWGYTYYYLRLDGTTWQINSTNSNNGQLKNCTITSQNMVDNITKPTISISSANENTISFSHNGISGTYTPGYTRYQFNNSNHYWYNDADHNSAPSAVNANTLNPTYTWSLTANGGGVASINGTTGVLTLSGAPTGNITVRLTIGNLPSDDKTVDFTLTRTHYNENVSTTVTMSAVTLSPTSATLDYGDGQEFTASATVDATTTTTEAYDRLQGGGNTYYYYDSELHTSTPSAVEVVTHPEPTYSWSLTGAAANGGYLTPTSGSGPTITIDYSSASSTQTTATLTVTASTSGASDRNASATITATRTMPTAISATPATVEMMIGATGQFTYSLTPAGAYDEVTATSENIGIATVSKSGSTITVTGVSKGSTTITLSAARPGSTALTTTVTVLVKEACATPTITITPTTDGTTATVTLSTATDGASIYYTTDGSNPTTSSTLYSDEFEIGNGGVVKAIAVKADYINSEVAREIYSAEKVATPTISIASSGVTFDCATAGVTFYYTTDGSTPTTSSTQWNGSPITSFSDGDVITVFATKQGMISSDPATKRYYPISGADGSTVTINDIEDHNWSYYSDAECPIHRLNPADVKITYYGNGNNVSTSNDAAPALNTFTAASTTVAVGHDAPENTFIYYKTLENANEDGTGDYPYTTIPNPFQVRPTYGDLPATRTVYLVTSSNNAGRGTLTVTYTNASGGSATETVNINSANFNNTRSITVKTGSTITVALSRTAGTVTTVGRYDANDGNQIWSFNRNNNGTTTNNYTEETLSSFTGYRGFYAWRIKSLSSGLTIRGKNVDDTINAESPIVFETSNATGNEVALEALWSRAYVTTGTGDLGTRSSGANAYERNFHVVTTATTAGSYNQSYPHTVTAYYPNGTPAGGSISGAFTAAADTKFEDIEITGATNSTWTAAGNDLIIGRGCSGSVGTVRGLSGNTSGAVKYTIRLESGTLGTFNMIDGTTHTHSGTVSAKTVFGCDYDRAKEDNNKLSIGNNNTVYGASQYQAFSSNTNRNNLTYDWHIKSGQVQAGRDVAAGSAAECIYMGNSGNGNDSDGNLYQGKRRMIMEGGEVCNIAGGLNNYGNNYANYIVNDGWALQIRIKGGTVRGSVYGAAEFAGASGDRQFIITGGTINGWVAGGANGTHNDGGELYGSTALYIGGTAVIGSESGGTHVGGYNSSYGTNGADGGNVFGAGCGILPNNGNFQTGTVGRVNNSTVIVADETHIWRDVHGGGNYGWVRDNGTSSIYILGGTIGGNDGYGNVFGGSNNQQGQEVAITVKGGDVKGGVYGGSHSWGVINDNVTMNISGGLIETGAFGGGYGTADNSCDVTGTVGITMTGGTVLGGLYGGGNINSKISDAVTININGGQVGEDGNEANVHGGGLGNLTRALNSVTVNIGSRTDDCNVSGTAVIYGDVYGGSAEGKTNGNTNRENNAVTNVTLNKGTINGSLYGGGLGSNSPNYAADVYGPVAVKVYGGTLTGGVYGANNVNGAPQSSVTVDIYGTDAQPGVGYAIANVYGGGNQAAYNNANYPTVTVHNCNSSIGNVYGGGNAAAVTNTNVTIYGGNRIGAVYAGGNGTGVANNFTMVSGNAVAKIYGGTIGRVFAGNNSSGIVSGSKTVTIDAGTDETINAANCITCGNSPMKIGAVFHGGNNAAGSPGTVNIVCTGATTAEYIDTLFGGANNANIVNNNMSTAADVTLTIDRGHIRTGIFGGNNAGGKVTGNITINLKRNSGGTCAFNYPTVFGGGFGEATETGGNITINIGEETSTATAPTIDSTIAGGAIYGGSALGSVNDASNETTTINIYNGTITGNIYGGGLGEAGNATKGKVNGAVAVNISTEDQTKANCAIDLRNSSIYGCNNTGGSPQGDVRIDVWKTGFLTDAYSSAVTGTLYAIDQVFGGGNAADYNPAGDNKATVYIHDCVNSIRRVFGGGNAAAAKGVVTTIDGGRYDYIFGGGNGEVTAANIGSGGTNLTVNAGRINHLFGGSNERGSIAGPMRTNVNYSKLGTDGCDELIIEFFGGGNLAPIGSEGNPVNLSTTIECNTIFSAVYGGSNLADIYGDVTLTINGGTIIEAYGGSKGRLADNSDPEHPITAKAADIHGNVKLNIYGGDIGRAYGGSNINGDITGAIGVDLDWKGDCPGKSVDYIYGGSNQAAYTPTASGALSPNFSPTVKLINGVVNYNVYGGGRGGSATVTANPKVIAGDGTTPTNSANVQGDIFGGGDAANVVGKTNVKVVHNSKVGGNVFGGGNAAEVSQDTEVEIKDQARIGGNVYGGGNEGAIGGNTKVIINSSK
ncbi:MAG: chitobiase/beta-hexosaminidase C-terminal domain-containing protein [Bacteroidales bacterium]|nr:chitobiase/beta-hexosaminidase C-terminal domain-containing protein [Bacteroidales bacterium]